MLAGKGKFMTFLGTVAKRRSSTLCGSTSGQIEAFLDVLVLF